MPAHPINAPLSIDLTIPMPPADRTLVMRASAMLDHESGRYKAASLTMDDPINRISSTRLGSIALARLMGAALRRQLRELNPQLSRNHAVRAYLAQKPVTPIDPDTEPTDKQLADAGAVYRLARMCSDASIVQTGLALGVPHPTARRWIARARAAGLVE